MHEEKKVEETKPIDVEHTVVEENSKEPKEKAVTLKIDTKTAIVVAALIILAALGFYYRGSFIAATVNGTPISRFAVMQQAEKQDGKAILENLIVKQLIRSEAMKKKVRVTPADISAEITKLEAQLKGQNTTLDQALLAQGMSRATLEEQILLQKQVEKLVSSSSTAVTDAEVTAYIAANKITIPAGQEATTQEQIKKQMEQDKFSRAAQKYVEDLKTRASIKYLINY
ncbi:MAG: SurA N-terminal domain-containing protein [Candidatus Paceibacterota bacterium]|jgi:hypothetical protein|nr:SurA N-terminal domain-containing protein [Candidatus Paceibacterota bacterium]